MLSNLTALAAARERAQPGSRIDGCDGRGVVYTSAEAHSSVERAVEVLGLGRRARCGRSRSTPPGACAPTRSGRRSSATSPTACVPGRRGRHGGDDAHRRRRPDPGGRRGVRRPTASGCTSTARTACRRPRPHRRGTCSTGSSWPTRPRSTATSGSSCPRPAACSWCARRADLEAAFSHDAPYIPEIEFGEHPVEWTLEYSRPFRALKLWLALRAHGAEAFREAIEHDLALARLVADLVRAADDLELLYRADALDRALPAHPGPGRRRRAQPPPGRAMQRDGRVYVTGAVVDGRGACGRAWSTTARPGPTPTRSSTSPRDRRPSWRTPGPPRSRDVARATTASTRPRRRCTDLARPAAPGRT